MTQSGEKRKKLLENLGQIMDEYDRRLGSESNTLKLERMEYDAPTDDEIEKLAKESVESKYKAKKQDAESQFETKKQDFESKIQAAAESAERKKAERLSDYEQSEKNMENQMLKRGVQRSSIAVGELGELENAKQAELKEIASGLNSQVSALNGEIEKLTEKLNESLKEYDMEKAIEINEEIDKLKDERQKRMDEVLKYNNSIAEKEKSYNDDFYEKHPNIRNAIIEEYNNKLVNAALDYYYASFATPEEAYQAFIDDEELLGYLGKKNYDTILNILEARF